MFFFFVLLCSVCAGSIVAMPITVLPISKTEASKKAEVLPTEKTIESGASAENTAIASSSNTAGVVSPSGASEMNLTLYRNGYALALRKFTLPLKQGKQTVRIENFPKTLHIESVMPSFEGDTEQLDVFSQVEDNGAVVLDVMSAYEQTKTLDLRYLFDNLGWDVFYVGVLSPDQKFLSLKGWIEVKNNAGMDIRQAQILFQGSDAHVRLEESAGEGWSEFSYLFPRAVDLPMGKTTYLSFLYKAAIPLKQDHIVYVGGDFLCDLKNAPQTPEVLRVFEFQNDAAHGFQYTLPAGKITLYQANKGHMDELMGSRIFSEKTRGKPVALSLNWESTPSPLLCELEQTDYKKILANSSEAGYRIVLTNRHEAPLSVRVIVNLPECEWNIIRTSLSYTTDSKRQLSWIVDVPGGQNVELKYRIKMDNIRS